MKKNDFHTKKTAAKRMLSSFTRREDGAGLIIFGLLLVVVMLSAGGLAVDSMRFESERSRLQNVTDSAALAAASLSQTRDPEDVVRDYFQKAGLSHALNSVVVDPGLNYREVRIEASLPMNTLLMRLIGITQLTVPSVARAEERINNVEVSLVIDLSGSMGQGERMPNLRGASLDFVEALLGEESDGQISISMIPYTGQVNPGPAILSHFDVNHAQNYSHCVDFAAQDFNTTRLGQSLAGAGHGMTFVGYSGIGGHPPAFYTCPIAPGNVGLEVVPFQTDIDLLTARINAMQPLGATSIDIGMKWGAGLLDPAFRPVAASLADLGIIEPEFAMRPLDFDEPDTMKVIVLMTDGENFPEYRLPNFMKSGPSNVWVNNTVNGINTYSVLNSNLNQYYWRHDGSWNQHPYGNEPVESCSQTQVCTQWRGNGTCHPNGWETQTTCEMVPQEDARRLDWPELLHRATVAWVQNNLQTPAGINITNSIQNISTFQKDQRLQDICNAAKQQGIIVFTVAFEAPANGATQLRRCASSNAHHFDVDGLEIRSAFRAIALQISQLRLTE